SAQSVTAKPCYRPNRSWQVPASICVWHPAGAAKMYKLTSTSFLSVMALLLAVGTSPAMARGNSDWRDCNGRDGHARISAVSPILDQSGSRSNSTMRAGAFNNRGIAYFSKGEFDRAVSDFEEAIAAKPNNPVLHHNRGMALFNKGDNEGAIRAYEDAI